MQPGRLYIATDTSAYSKLGHGGVVSAGTRALMLPFKEGIIPVHTAIPGECGRSRTGHGARDEL